jgi:hypothetical protein
MGQPPKGGGNGSVGCALPYSWLRKKMVQGLTGKDESTVEALSGTVHQNG